ncbi:3-oxoacyl-ACP reductase [Sphingobium lactosutens]|uniref:alpha/beta fold hydrolase n=1 Tax=Sphingobium lactosutens TaxID=522773 RepID=UPI0015BE1B58|nr:alpha/beta fold hydrolase [Sphingobium lactosutens]NWK96101.1 3-oxoacyl-ACP reductase [Sphingobium lactosutens]
MTQELSRKTYGVTGGHCISVAEVGIGPVIVFVHGSGPGASGASNFRQNVQAFVDGGYRVILPDLIGYGQSSKPEGIDYTLGLFTDTLHEALTAHGVERAILVGNSLGGGIALQMALDHPDFVDRLILMAPGCIHEREDYFRMPGIAGMVSSFGGPDFNEEEQRRLITNLVHDPVHVTDALVKERFAVARTQPKDVIMRMRTPNLAPRLGELKMPILLFWGFNERFMPLEGINLFFEACEDVRCVTFNKVGHWVQVERAEEFNRYALDFLHG